MSKKSLAVAAIVTSAVIWGVSIPLMKVNLNTIPPVTLAFLRFAPASFLCLIFADFRKIKLADIRRIGFWAIIGIGINLHLLLIGLKLADTVNASIIFTLTPVITSILAVFALREKIITSHIIGIVIAFTGALIYVLYPLVSTGNKNSGNLLGDLLLFLSVITASIFAIGSKKLFDNYAPSTVAGVSFLVGAVSFIPGSIWESYHNPTWMVHFGLFNLASMIFFIVGTSFLAFLIYEWGLDKVPVHLSAVIGYLTPAVSIVIAYAVFNEKLNDSFLVSTVLIVIGIYLVLSRKAHLTHHHRIHKV